MDVTDQQGPAAATGSTGVDGGGAPAAGPTGESVEVPLPQDLTAPKVARGAVRRVLDRWGLHAVLDPVLLAVSELVTNALRHGRPPVALRLARRGRSVCVDVHDGSRDLPGSPVRDRGDEAESGRGLGLVEAVAADTGVQDVPDDGKWVWARFDPEPPTDRG